MTGHPSRNAALVLAIALASLLLAAPALAAEWVEVPAKWTWNRTTVDFCNHPGQCLVEPGANPARDNNTARYFTGPSASDRPKCITNGQFIERWYCAGGNWTTRSRPLVRFLLEYASDVSPDDFAIFCGPFAEALNHVSYAPAVAGESISAYFTGPCSVGQRTVPCSNDVCVLRAGATVAVGTTHNVPLTHARSFLRALNLSQTACSNVAASATDFIQCTDTDAWHNPALNATVYITTGSMPAADPLEEFVSSVREAWAAIRGYLLGLRESGIGLEQHRDFTLYNSTPPQYLKLYIAKKDSREVLAFLDHTQDPLAPGGSKDYLGVRYKGLTLGTDPCGTYITAYDSKAHCTVADGALLVASRRVTGEPGASRPTPLNRAFSDLGAKLRMT